MRGVIRSVGTVAPATRKRNKAREKEYGSIRPMTTMEGWDMSAQEAYASKSAMKRLDVVPDIGPAAGMVKKVITVPSGKFLGGQVVRQREVYGTPGSRIEWIKRTKESADKTSDLMKLPRSQGPTYEISWLRAEGAEKAVKTSDPSHTPSLLRDFAKDLAKQHPGEVVEIHAPASDDSLRSLFDKFGIWNDEYKFGRILVKDGKVVKPPKMGKPNVRGDRAGPMVQKAGSGEPYKSMPQSRQGEVSKTSVTPFELQQLGLSKGAEPWDMGSKTTLGPATRRKK